jgi:plasmid stabilization system protein ParE
MLEHILRDDPAAAARVDDRLLAAIERLAAGEFEGPETTLTTGEVVRSWPVRPFRIYYQRAADDLLIVRIYHQARSPIEK